MKEGNRKSKASSITEEALICSIYKPGIELFLRRATPKLSSPQQRFTSEFGKVSVWFHRAIDTRKNSGQLSVISYQISDTKP